MQSHDNNDFDPELLASLQAKAERMTEEGKNTITAGAEGEELLAKYTSDRVSVKKLPDDEHGILRISIGGILDGRPGPWGYLVFRGDKDKVRKLLQRALRALG